MTIDLHISNLKVQHVQILSVHRSAPACGPDDGISNGFRPPSKQHRSELYHQMLDIMLHSTNIIYQDCTFPSSCLYCTHFQQGACGLFHSTDQLIIGWCGWRSLKVNKKVKSHKNMYFDSLITVLSFFLYPLVSEHDQMV